MSPEMYMILGVGVGLAGLVLTLFVATWQMVNSRFNSLRSDMNARFAEVNARFDSTGNDMNARFDNAGNEVNARFAEVNARFDSIGSDINARFNEVNERFLQMQEYIRQLTAVVFALAERVARLEGLMGVRQEINGRGDD